MASPDVAAIRARGRRLTRQRVLIWDTLVERRGSHLSAAEIAAAVKAKTPDLHRATIYRTLDVLVDEGLALRTDLGGDGSHYELTAGHRHHHVVCTSCGAVAHVHDEAVETMLAGVEQASGYALTDVVVSGRCPGCRATAAQAAGSNGTAPASTRRPHG